MVDVKQFSAIGDGMCDDTQAIQRAIDSCAKENLTLIISKGTYKIGTLKLRTNSHIVFEEGAIFSGIESVKAYSADVSSFIDAVGFLRGKALLLVHNAKHVVIEGKGIITGNGPNVQVEKDRPFLVRIAESEDVTIRDVKLMNSISWCLHIQKSKKINVQNINIYNRGCWNNDGIDIDSSSNVSVVGCNISSADDSVCIKTTSNMPTTDVYVKNCKISSNWAAFKIGTESVGNVSNITVENCEFYDVYGSGISIVPTDGAVVENVKIKNISMRNSTVPVFVANGERNREYAGEKNEQLSKIKNVEINGIEADVVPVPFHGYYYSEEWGNVTAGIILSGTVKNKLENIRLINMKLSLPGGYGGPIDYNVRELEAMYPSFQRFDPVPAKGIYIRHAQNVFYDNIEISYKNEDVRPEIYTDDVE